LADPNDVDCTETQPYQQLLIFTRRLDKMDTSRFVLHCKSPGVQSTGISAVHTDIAVWDPPILFFGNFIPNYFSLSSFDQEG
jgi:hypothetical protein